MDSTAGYMVFAGFFRGHDQYARFVSASIPVVKVLIGLGA